MALLVASSACGPNKDNAAQYLRGEEEVQSPASFGVCEGVRGDLRNPEASTVIADERRRWIPLDPSGMNLESTKVEKVTTGGPGIDLLELDRLPGGPGGEATNPRVVLTVLERLQAAEQSGYRLYLSSVSDSIFDLGAAVSPDGEVYLVANCAESFTHDWQGFVKASNASGETRISADIFADLVTSPADSELRKEFRAYVKAAHAQKEPVPWSDQPPATRQFMDLGSGEELTQALTTLPSLGQRDVTFVVPPTWRTGEALLCTRTSQGWNPCLGLDADGVFADGYETLPLVYVKGEALEIVLLGSDGDLTKPLRTVGSLDSTALDTSPHVVAVPNPSATGASVRDATNAFETMTTTDATQILQMLQAARPDLRLDTEAKPTTPTSVR